MEVHSQDDDKEHFSGALYQLLPFPCLPHQWYRNQGKLSQINAARTKVRQLNPIDTDDAGDRICLKRSQIGGSLEANIQSLADQIIDLKDKPSCASKLSHLNAVREVAEYVLLNGPLVATQDAAKVYTSAKSLQRNKDAGELYEILCKYLNLMQVYICGKGYLIQSTGTNVENLIQTIANTVNEEKIVNERVSDRLQSVFKTALEYADTPRDKQLIKGLIAELTSITFTAKLQGIESRQGTRSAKSALKCNLKHYTDIQRTSQTVRSDLTVKQQHRLIQRIISARKVKEIRTIAEGRGRKLKSSEYPELAAVLEYAFGQLDVASGGGGLEAHPRLTTGTLYRAADSATTMRKARETVLSLAPQGFSISLSACYNYTENYRKGTAQAQRHHFGKGVNAALMSQKATKNWSGRTGHQPPLEHSQCQSHH